MVRRAQAEAGSGGSGPSSGGSGSGDECDGFEVLQTNCGSSGCHGEGSLYSNFAESEEIAVSFVGESGDATCAAEGPLIDPDNPPPPLERVKLGEYSAFKSSIGAEIRFFMPVLNVPFRLIFAMNPSRGGVLDNQLLPEKKFKFRFGYTPIEYDAETVLERSIVFNGQEYDVGLPVNSRFEWKDWRFGLEYDFVYGSRGYLGFIAEAKYTDVEVDLTSPLTSEFTNASAPIVLASWPVGSDDAA